MAACSSNGSTEDGPTLRAIKLGGDNGVAAPSTKPGTSLILLLEPLCTTIHYGDGKTEFAQLDYAVCTYAACDVAGTRSRAVAVHPAKWRSMPVQTAS
ncbi:hypothetical protein [Jatrophihabitans fulvus]